MAKSNSTIEKDRDCYGDLDPKTDDLENLESAITGLLIEHPITPKYAPYGGSAVYAKLVDALLINVNGEEAHPKSEFALRMAAIAEGIVSAVVERLKNHFDWDDATEEEAIAVLMKRRRIGVCAQCKAPTPRPRYWFCDQCEQKFALERAKETA